jgi:hypothetical protein
MLRSAPLLLRRGALLIRGPSLGNLGPGSASHRKEALRRVRDTRKHLRLHRWPLRHAIEPCLDMAIGGIERLADLVGEIEPAIEQDVGERKTLAAEKFPSVRHLAVEPGQAVGGDHLQSRRSLWRHRNALFEKPHRLAEAIAVGEVLADVEVDAPRPHPALGLR